MSKIPNPSRDKKKDGGGKIHLSVTILLVLVAYMSGRMSVAVNSLQMTSEPSKVNVETAEEDAIPKNKVVGLGLPNTHELIGKSVWDVLPMEHTKQVEFWPGLVTDSFTPFHNYLRVLGRYQPDHKSLLPDLPLFHTWPQYFEAYHNHFHRFRGARRVVFMEVGVQSGGKIAAMRDYFGPGFEYIGIDVNPSTRKFDAADWVNIEIGDSGDRNFWNSIKTKYPHVDIFLDDGGHRMNQQRLALEVMLPHLQSEGVFFCEDINTSWSKTYGGIPAGDTRNTAFMETTFVGLAHRTMDWFMAGWLSGNEMKWKLPADNTFPDTWWKVVPDQVKHIHLYNQAIVYEKGLVRQSPSIMTTGSSIPYRNSGEHSKTDWPLVLSKLQNYTESNWDN